MRAKIDDALKEVKKCNIRIWHSQYKCEVSSKSRSNVYYNINVEPGAKTADLCSNGCCVNRVGLCTHVLCALESHPSLKYSDYLPEWQTLRGWASQLGVPLQPSPDGHVADWKLYELPTKMSPLAHLGDPNIRTDVLAADFSAKMTVGRRKGTVEQNVEKKRRLEQETAAGASTGINTTPIQVYHCPLRNPLPNCIPFSLFVRCGSRSDCLKAQDRSRERRAPRREEVCSVHGEER